MKVETLALYRQDGTLFITLITRGGTQDHHDCRDTLEKSGRRF